MSSMRTCNVCEHLKEGSKYIEPRIINGKKRWANQTDLTGSNILPPSDDRGKLRSLTYQGIADAMANQWG